MVAGWKTHCVRSDPRNRWCAGFSSRSAQHVAVDRASPEVMTPGVGLEWTPVITGDGRSIAFIGATAQRPPVVGVMPINGGATNWVGAERIPADFPTQALVTPRKIVYRSPDG